MYELCGSVDVEWQTAVTAYFSSKQLPLFAFALRCWRGAREARRYRLVKYSLCFPSPLISPASHLNQPARGANTGQNVATEIWTTQVEEHQFKAEYHNFHDLRKFEKAEGISKKIIHSFIDSFIHSFIHSFIYLFVGSLIRSFTHEFVRLYARSSFHSLARSLVRSSRHTQTPIHPT